VLVCRNVAAAVQCQLKDSFRAQNQRCKGEKSTGYSLEKCLVYPRKYLEAKKVSLNSSRAARALCKNNPGEISNEKSIISSH
jgi:hypothetical protein